MRQIYIVNATQVVVSENHPEGAYSTVSGFPKTYDSRNYNASTQNPDGNPERAFEVAQAEFLKQRSDFLLANNRAMWTVTFGRADGKQLDQASKGAFPYVAPQPEPQPEPEPEPEVEPEEEPTPEHEEEPTPEHEEEPTPEPEEA